MYGSQVLVSDYATAKDYMATPRCSKVDRPLYHPSARLQARGDSYAVVLYNTDVVTYHPDDSVTINTGGWFTNSTMSRINAYAPQWVPRVFRHRNKLWLSVKLGETPVRQRRCSCCHGALAIEDATLRALAMLNHKCNGYFGSSWSSFQHDTQCSQCDNTGMVAYGGNPIYQQWDGNPLTIRKGQ